MENRDRIMNAAQKAKIKVSSKVITVTPEAANKMLSRNSKMQRKPMRPVIDRYADDMENNRWELNGQAIIISDTAEILDGQNRLFACVKAETSFTTVVTSGIAADTFYTLDTGARRTLPQILEMQGEKSCATLAGSLNVLATYLGRSTRVMRGNSVGKQLYLLDKYPTMRESVKVAGMYTTTLFPSTSCFVHFIASHSEPDDANRFISAMKGHKTVEDGKKYSAPELLREKMQYELANHMRGSREAQIGFAITAFNNMFRGQEVNFLKYKPGQPWPEFASLKGKPFPGRLKS